MPDLHAVLRGDLQAMEMRLDRMEFECRQLRALVSTMRLLADDVQTLEAGQGDG